jgi:cellulose synthase/poly-beta-1,6-N-acetylglucosamine synthase-like glycosyltransferase/exo-beta-1,3-glucanase (GH17 family)
LTRATWITLLLGAIANLTIWACLYQAHDMPDWKGSTLAGVSYSPYTANQDPAAGDMPTSQEIKRDLDILQQHTARIRTYSALGALQTVPRLAEARGISVTAGAWISKDADRNLKEIESLIALNDRHENIDRLVVGNEVLLRDDIPVDDLIAAIAHVRKQSTNPVGTAEPWHIWLQYPALARSVDFIGIQLLPYWEGVPAGDAIPYLNRRMDQIAARYPDKPIVLTEIGWPSAGRAIGGARGGRIEQALFLRTFLNQSRNLDYFVIEGFDQPWKIMNEGMAGGYWGLYDADRKSKFPWTGTVRERDDWPIWALLATIFGLLPAARFARARPSLRPQGAALLAGVGLVAGNALVWALLPTTALYLSSIELAVWSVLFGTALFLISGVLIDAIEATDLIWNGPLQRQFSAASSRGAGTPLPKVTVHVPIHNEPPEMVRRTLNALANLDYPDYEVIVLENNTNDPALWQPVEAQCRALGSQFKFHRYGALSGYKGGALNRALAHSATGASIVAVIDSDYIVDRNWLKALVPLFIDPAIGYVQAPQDYHDRRRNTFKDFCFWEYAGFFRIGMVRRNEDDAIIQHGTMTLIRRDALQTVGGWSEWCITEDAELGLRLTHSGWKSAYVTESYGRGVTPDSLAAYKAQRFRWAYGAMQILKRRWNWLATGRDTKLTRAQRFHYLAGWLPWLSDAAGLLFTVGALAWTAMLIVAPTTTELPAAAFLIPTLAAFVFRQWRLFKLYGQSVPIAAADRVKAALAGLALSHTVAKAVIWGLFTSGRPFFRTPKCRRGPAIFRGLAMASEEGSILCVMMAASAGFIVTNDLWHLDAWLWLTVLAVMALPYAATVLLGAINGIPRRTRTRAYLGGAAPPVPAFPPSERRNKRKGVSG